MRVQSGHSRILVLDGNRFNIQGLLFLRDLAFVDPDGVCACVCMCVCACVYTRARSRCVCVFVWCVCVRAWKGDVEVDGFLTTSLGKAGGRGSE